MFPMRASLASLLAVVVLAGCSSNGGSPKAPEVAAAPNLDGRCEASGAEFTLGKPASAELLEQARKASGAQIARVLKPDDVVTLEYRSERLNLHTDEKGVISRANCG